MVDSEESEAIPKTNSSSNGNGPRVSFNRDVHVKRYGSLLNNDILNYDSNSRSQSPNLRREFVDLSDAAALEREAALVLEQVNNFGSLPHRKSQQQQQQHLKKPLLRRSKSDASSSSKKAKRNSIFNFFNSSSPAHPSPSSSTTTNSISQANNSNNNLNKKASTNERPSVNIDNTSNGSKKVTRSKSDTSNMQKRDKYRNKIQLNTSSLNGNLTSSDSSDNNNTHLTNSLKRQKIPLSPISEVNTPVEVGSAAAADYFSSRQVATDTAAVGHDLAFKSCENLAQTPVNSKVVWSKSMESMHSSQMPAEKPPLTKNMKVDKMVKRLSMERLSPPPATVLQAGGFSYTNPQLSPTSPITLSPNKLKSYSPPPPPLHLPHHPPAAATQQTATTPPQASSLVVKSEHSNNHVVYAQVAACNDTTNADDNKAIQSHQTVQNTQKKKSRESASPTHIPSTPTNDFNDKFINLAPTPVGFADRDETDNIASTVTTTVNEEPIIRPNIRRQIPRFSSNSNIDHINNYYLDNEFDRLNDMRETDFNGIDASLSSRREILESRIKSRIGGLHHINNENHHHTRANALPPTTKHLPPPQQQQQQSQQQQRVSTHKYGSNEIINRYSPERKQHHEFTKASSPLKHDQNSKVMNLENGSMRKNSSRYDKTTDSGNETDNVARNNYRNRRYSSRFNIGRKWNYEDDIIECELFLMKERKHTEETYPYQLVRTYVYRQHSNNDDQYDTDQDKKNILKEWKQNKKMTREFLKSQKKKKSGLEKVKELFKSKKSSERSEESELKARYREYSPEKIEPPQKTSGHQSIINRRRLSTPQASPIIPNRSKSLPPKAVNRNNAAPPSTTSTLKREKESNAQKFNWFASLERMSRRKNRDTSDASTIDRKSSITRSKSSSMKNVSLSNGSSKTLRFFGDTDADETDSVRRLRSSRESREKSSSLQNLNSSKKNRQSKSISRSRQELLNIAESTSDEQNTIEKPIRSRPVSPSINKFIPPPRPPKSSKLVSTVSSTLPRAPPRRKYGHDEIEEDLSYRDTQDSSQFYQKSDSNLTSARRLRESLSVSRENLHRDRFDSDASQRSVVYLHASVVGDIPSQTLGRRMSGKSSVRTAAHQEEQASTRTVNRSFSLAAPWKPKFISDGYEINYNNDQQKVAHNKNRYRSKSATRERERSRWDRKI